MPLCFCYLLKAVHLPDCQFTRKYTPTDAADEDRHSTSDWLQLHGWEATVRAAPCATLPRGSRGPRSQQASQMPQPPSQLRTLHTIRKQNSIFTGLALSAAQHTCAWVAEAEGSQATRTHWTLSTTGPPGLDTSKGDTYLARASPLPL